MPFDVVTFHLDIGSLEIEFKNLEDDAAKDKIFDGRKWKKIDCQELTTMTLEDVKVIARLIETIKTIEEAFFPPLNELSKEILQQLRATNDCKKLNIFIEGVPSILSLNSSGYNQAKSSSGVSISKNWVEEMRPTTQKAFEFFCTLHSGEKPKHVIDYGAGQGCCSFALHLLGCEKISAVEADAGSVQLFNDYYDDLKKTHRGLVGNIKVFPDCLVNIAKDLESTDLMIASYTLPYRKKSEFQEVWQIVTNLIKVGSVFAGQFFTLPFQPSATMTYHTPDEAERLLVNSNFHILFFEIQKEGFVVFNANNDGLESHTDDPKQRPWGHLIHFVAQKMEQDQNERLF